MPVGLNAYLLNFAGLYCFTLMFLRQNEHLSLKKCACFSASIHSFSFKKVRWSVLNQYIYAKSYSS